MTNTYTDEQRTEAVAEQGATIAAATIGCHRSMIYKWVRAAVSTDIVKTPAELAEEAAYQHRLRTSLRLRMLNHGHELMDRINEPHIDFKVTKEGVVQVEYPTARSGDVKNYVTSVAIMIDKYRLEMGESTDRTEHTGDLAVTINGVDVAALK